MASSSRLILISLATLCFAALSARAQSADPVPDWPDHFDPFNVLVYNLEMSRENWETVRHDLSFDIEVPSLLSANGEAPVLVSVRRKSATAFPDESDPQKVALKIDINEYAVKDAAGNIVCADDHGFVAPVCVKTWHDLKKLSLESGDDNNVVTEGIAWYLHRLASETLDYTPGLAAWIELYITLTDENGDSIDGQTFYNGVFVNVEQHDKQFLKNHGLWAGSDATWLTKVSDVYSPSIKEAPEDEFGDPIESPTARALNFRPFQQCGRGKRSGGCDTQPSDVAFVDTLDHYVNTEGVLTLAAVSAFHVSPDDLFSKGKNFFHVDYSDVSLGRREYLQWDLDAAFAGLDVAADIYGQGKGQFGDYEDWIIDESAFKDRYSQTIQALLDGPFNATELSAALTSFQALLEDALESDPHANLPDGVAGEFDFLRGWLAERIVHVQAQLPGSPPPPGEELIHVGDLTGSSAPSVRNRWEATAAIDIHDSGHGPVDGATVSGSWSTGGGGSCVTVLGTCDIRRTGIRNRLDRTTFSVRKIDLPGVIYDAGANDVSDSIVIQRP